MTTSGGINICSVNISQRECNKRGELCRNPPSEWSLTMSPDRLSNAITAEAESAERARVSRRSFLKATAAAGGGLLLSVSLPALLSHGGASAGGSFAPNAFIRIDPDGRVTLIMHKVEMGQGTYPSMPMLLAEELEVDLSQVRLEHAPP